MNIVSNGHTEAVLFRNGDSIKEPSVQRIIKHIANRAFFGSVMRIYHCGFNDGKRVLAIVNPKTWQVLHTMERQDMDIPQSIQG